MELTKEYFDKQLNSLANKQDLEKLTTKEDLEKLATKDELQHEISELAGMIERRFDEVEKKLDVREEVVKLKSQMQKVWDALHL